jgi:3-methylcrotonyl-CoA carboxylase alpha subunit
MFKKILIANRGEIAIRIIKTLRKLGMQSVAIYSSADRFHPHVQMADEAYWIGEASPQKSYLNIEKIIETASIAQVDAIHPGYGFLSENPEFARACEKANIVFIGPSSKAMENVGSKQKAKVLLANTNVPLVPGFNPSNPSDEELLQAAQKLGFPLVIKAAHGGGGKGLKIVHQASEWQNALSSARREAKAYFGNDELLLEKFIENPRHLEVQIFGDHLGHVVHLFERDCSVQRRQQKIVEEAPAIHLSKTLRKQLYEHALEVAKTFEYTNAGTVEFLLTADETLYFMEMNARLQVEHPITEAITGLDLVELQIQIAQGKAIPFTQPTTPKGHAIECRICAEQPKHDFKPSQGQINRLIWPKFGRVDTGIECHQVIQSHYDSLLAKEIAWGETREKAIIEMQNMLHETDIFGIESNLDYLKLILNDKTWQKGAVPIHFLLNHKFHDTQTPKSIIILAACALELHALQEKNQTPKDLMQFSNISQRFWPIQFSFDNELYQLKISSPKENYFVVEYQAQNFEVFFHNQAHQLYLEINQQCYRFQVDKKLNYFTIHDQLNSYEIHQVTRAQSNTDNQQQDTKIRSPMPATIVAIYKKTGDIITKGEPLLVLEAMKMEHTIYAPDNANIKEIFYQQGQQVQEGCELVELSYDK